MCIWGSQVGQNPRERERRDDQRVCLSAENVAEACFITRHDQDEYAVQSQVKCERALSLGHFDAEIEPILISTGKRKSPVDRSIGISTLLLLR